MREGFGKEGAWVWVWPELMEAQQEQGEPQSEAQGESDSQEQDRVPAAQPAMSVTSPPIAAAQLQASVPIPKFV